MKNRGQSAIEYMCFVVICVSAIVVMSTYIKRAFMGNWHTQAISVYPDMYDKMGSSNTSTSGKINSQFVGFSRGGAGWIAGWSLWR